MDFIRGQNTSYFFRDFDFKYDFGPVKLPGLSRNGPQKTAHYNLDKKFRTFLTR